MADIRFGTDGWRGVIAEEFTFANVARVAQATALHWATSAPDAARRVVLGYDRRFLSAEFARLTAEVFAGNDFEVLLTPDPTPTPCVSFEVQRTRAAGGVVITASHNPPRFNGFKLKAHFGGPADPAECQAVEARLDEAPVRRLPWEAALAERRVLVRDARPAHFRAIRRLVDFPQLAKSRLRVGHDALFGVGAGCFAQLLAGTTCRVTTLNADVDPLFGGINPEPLARYYHLGAAALRRRPQDICLVTDGDADRLGAMDGRGGAFTNQEVIALLLHHLARHRSLRGRVVKTTNTTALLDRMCAAWDLPLTEVGIGFKYIAAEMRQGDVLMGAEESGSIGFGGHIPERDGLAAGLYLLELLALERVPARRILARLERAFGPHRYGRLDARVPLERRREVTDALRREPPDKLGTARVIAVKTIDGVKFEAADGSWLGLRGSGTEDVLRLYAEASSPEELRRRLRQGVRLLTRILGQRPHCW